VDDLAVDLRVALVVIGDVEPGLEVRHEIKPGQHAAEQCQLCLPLDAFQKHPEGLLPTIIAKVIQTGVRTRLRNQRIRIQRTRRKNCSGDCRSR
jgi:hypothetical protein